MLLIAVLANVSLGKKANPGGKPGSHRHHHHGKYDGNRGNGNQSANASLTDDGGVKTAESTNLPSVPDEPDVAIALAVPDVTDLPDSEVLDEVNELMNTTGNWFTDLLRNVSAYIPLNVQYATNAGNYCNPLEYNSPYYNVPSLIISGVLVVLGVLFCFFGQCILESDQCM